MNCPFCKRKLNKIEIYKCACFCENNFLIINSDTIYSFIFVNNIRYKIQIEYYNLICFMDATKDRLFEECDSLSYTVCDMGLQISLDDTLEENLYKLVNKILAYQVFS